MQTFVDMEGSGFADLDGVRVSVSVSQLLNPYTFQINSMFKIKLYAAALYDY